MEWAKYGTSTAEWGDLKQEAALEVYLKSLGRESADVVRCKQVHGNGVEKVLDREQKIFPKCDGLLTQLPGILLGIFTADCVPIFLFDKKNKAVGLLHAGWRGAVQEISLEGSTILRESFGSEPSHLKVVLGPHIQECCFEVGLDIVDQFPQEAVRKKSKGFYVNLSRVIGDQLVRFGVLKKNIKVTAECTYHDSRYFSYRRDKTNKRMLSYIGIV